MNGAKGTHSSLDTRFGGVLVHHVYLGEQAIVGTKLSDHRLSRILVQVKNDHLAAGAGNTPRYRLTYA